MIFQMLPTGKFDENLIKVTFATFTSLHGFCFTGMVL
jgi:hypothetical protein